MLRSGEIYRSFLAAPPSAKIISYNPLSLCTFSVSRSENDTQMKFNPLNHLKDLTVTDANERVEGEQGALITVQFRLSATSDRPFCRHLNQLSPAQVLALIIEKSSAVMSPAVVTSELTNSKAERFILKPRSTNSSPLAELVKSRANQSRGRY